MLRRNKGAESVEPLPHPGTPPTASPVKDHNKDDGGISPSSVFVFLFFLLGINTIIYYFATPSDLKHRPSLSGPLGLPNAEFDWCEDNYLSHPLVAEPVNTATSLLYIAQPILFLRVHRIHLPLEALFCLASVAAIGIGSTLFHATLRYPFQLADELPMFALVIGAVAGLLRRKIGARPSRTVGFVILVGLGTLLLATERFDDEGNVLLLHSLCRGTLACLFSTCFLYIFYSAATLSRYDNTELRRRNIKPNAISPPALFRRQFLLWIMTITCWIADILCCHALQRLPLGLPFPHLHGLWHLGSAAGLHCMIVLLVWHDRLEEGHKTRSRMFCGVLPYLVEP